MSANNPNALNYTALVLGHKEIFGTDGGGIERVRKDLSDINLYEVMQFCSKIAMFLFATGKANMQAQAEVINTLFPEEFKVKLLAALENNIENNDLVILFHEQAILLLVKEALKYCPIEGGKKLDGLTSEKLGYDLTILTNECLGWDSESIIELPEQINAERVRKSFAQFSFFTSDNFFFEMLVRYDAIFREAKTILNNNALELDEIFTNATGGIDINSYFSLCLGILTNWFRNLNKENTDLNEALSNEWLICRNKYFKETNIADEQVDKILGFLSISPEEFEDKYTDIVKQVFEENDTYEYNFLLFIQKPLMKYPNDCYVCFSPRYLMERATEGVYWIIHDHLKMDDSTGLSVDLWSNVWGQAFENYVNKSFLDIFESSYLENFTVNGVERADGLLLAQEFSALIEIKKMFWKYKTKATGDKKYMTEEITKKIIKGGTQAKGLGQIYNNIQSFMSSGWDLPEGASAYFLPILVVAEKMPMFTFNRKFYEEITQSEDIYFDEQIMNPFIILDAEDIQVLKSYARNFGQEEAKRALFEYSQIFKDRSNGYPISSVNFKNFVFSKIGHLSYKNDTVLMQEFDDIFVKIKDLLFGNNE